MLPFPDEQLLLNDIGSPVASNNCPNSHCIKVMVPSSKVQPHNIQQTVQNVLQNSKMTGLVKNETMKVTAKIGASKKEETPNQQITSLDDFSKKGIPQIR